MGDDRTGSVAGGEWMHINGRQWSEIKRILVFAFIYEGAPNWKATDGVVTIFIPGQPEIEVRLNEEGGRYGMCAIALLENVTGPLRSPAESTSTVGTKIWTKPTAGDALDGGLQVNTDPAGPKGPAH